jgi:hypothetical protein
MHMLEKELNTTVVKGVVSAKPLHNIPEKASAAARHGLSPIDQTLTQAVASVWCRHWPACCCSAKKKRLSKQEVPFREADCL